MYKPYLKEWVVRKGNYGKRLTESTFMDALTLYGHLSLCDVSED